MKDPLYFVLLGCSVTAYPLQTVLMAKLYRSFDPILMTGYRGLSLGISGLVLLYGVPDDAYALLIPNLHWIVLACVSGAIANWLSGTAMRRIFVGINTSIASPIRIVLLSLIGIFVFGDSATGNDILCILVILASVLSFSLPGSLHKIAAGDQPRIGILLSILAGFALALTFSLFTHLSRTIDPLLASYVWELGIGISAILLYTIPFFRNSEITERPRAIDFFRALIYSAPTIVGTGCFACAITLGPLPLAGAIMSLSIFVTSILGAIVHKEVPPKRAVLAMVIIVGSLAALQL